MKRWLPSALLVAFAMTATLIVLYRVGPGSGKTTTKGGTDAVVSTQAIPSRSHHTTPAGHFDDARAEADSEESELQRDASSVTNDDPDTSSEVSFTADARPPAIGASDSLLSEAISIAAASAQRERERAELRQMPASELTHRDILLLADTVDYEANSRLRKVARKYALDEQQQERAFWVFAGASTAYHPALGEQTDPAVPDDEELVAPPEDAANEETVDELIHDLMDEAQRANFEDEWVNQDLWWTEIVGQLSDDLDEEQAAASEEQDEPGAGDQTAPEEHLGGNLFDLLGQ